MASSYETKVYPRLLNTIDSQVLIESFIEHMNALEVKRYKFKVTHDTYTKGAKPVAIPTFVYWTPSIKDGGRDSQTFSDEDGFTDKLPINLDLSVFLKKGDFNTIIAKHFGNGVPTFNCKSDICYEGRTTTYRSSKPNIASFSEWFRYLVVKSPVEIKDHSVRNSINPAHKAWEQATDRLRKQVLEMHRSESFKDDEREALVQYACTKIKECMMKFSHLGEDALKRGVQTFIIGDIMEL